MMELKINQILKDIKMRYLSTANSVYDKIIAQSVESQLYLELKNIRIPMAQMQEKYIIS
jgi:hypothetical protein